MGDRIELDVPARPEFLSLIRSIVTLIAETGSKLPDRRIEDLRLAVTEACANASGGTPASQKKTCAPANIPSAGATALKSTRGTASRRRQDMIALSSATSTVAGAGPNSRADAMKKVSETEMLAETGWMFNLNEPVTNASAPSSSHPSG